MIFPIILFVPVAASVGLYLWFGRFVGPETYWLIATAAAAVTAAVRIGLVTLGIYILEHDSSWLQLLAYAMALASLPEAVLRSQRLGSSVETLTRLSAFLLIGRTVWVFGIAYLAAAHGRGRIRTRP